MNLFDKESKSEKKREKKVVVFSWKVGVGGGVGVSSKQ